MAKILRNEWKRAQGEAFERASILEAESSPQGLHIDRLRFVAPGSASLGSVGAMVSVFAGAAELRGPAGEGPWGLTPGRSAYVPAGSAWHLEASAGTEIVRVRSPRAEQARGPALVIRDERFLAACATEGHALRWTLTPQYLSRRIFLHHDRALCSRSGDPVSWFHTTMFDVAGLPPNDEGRPVFKMSYNSRTEINVCHDVSGDAAVRFALHPYGAERQAWGPWEGIDGEASYHLEEAADGPEVERLVDEATGAVRTLRNKHEVRGSGHVTLFCLFDPAPTGVERHRPGEYSDYEPFADVAARPEYAAHQRAIARFDAMVDRLSLAEARGALAAERGSEAWATYEEGLAAQRAIEAQLMAAMQAAGEGRDRVVAPWLQ